MQKAFETLLFIFTAIFMSAFTASAQQKFVASASAQQVVPPASSAGRAVCRGAFNSAETVLSVECTYSNLSSNLTWVNVHSGAAVGQNIPYYLRLGNGSGGTSGTVFFGAGILSAQHLKDLRANRWYFTFSTANSDPGEIRGQVHLANSAYNDFDGDSRTDLTVYRNSNNTFYALRSLNGAFTEKQIGEPGDSVSLTVDFDGDGRTDAAVTRAVGGQRVFFILQSSSGEPRYETFGLPGDF